MMRGNLVILAGGVSSRMQAGALNAPGLDDTTRNQILSGGKTVVSMDTSGRPLLDYLLWNAITAGYARAVLVLGIRNRELHDYFDVRGRQGDFPGLTITSVVQPVPEGRAKPLGTADAFLCALRSVPDWAGQRCTVCNGDNLYSATAMRLLRESPADNALIDYDRAALQLPEDTIRSFAVLRKDDRGHLLDILEKPTAEEFAASRDAAGRVGVSMNIFSFLYDHILPVLEDVPLHPVRREKELPAAVRLLVSRRPCSVLAIPLAEHVPDLTHAEDIPTVRAYLSAYRGPSSVPGEL